MTTKTLSALNTLVSQDLRDASNLTFTSAMVNELINAALVEIGRIAPARFQTDLTPIADTLEYQLRPFGTNQTLTTPFGVASTNVLTCASHGRTDADPIRFLSLTGGTGLSVGTTYYIRDATTHTFKLCTIVAGTAVDFTTEISAGTFYRVTSDDEVPEIEVLRVELWDNTTTPASYISRVTPRYAEYVNSSEVGWELWNGTLRIPGWLSESLDPVEDYVLKIWGYAPFPALTSTNNVQLSAEQEYALRDYARVEAIKSLISSRELYSQWQTASRNSDTSLAALAGILDRVEASWKRRASALAVLREVR
jgi:hypothetical protein